MKILSICVCVMTMRLVAVSAAQVGPDLIVQTNLGKIQGFETATSNGKKVSAWYGVPFAQPPVGNLRFRHPRPADKWEGVKQTREQPNSCVQVRASNEPSRRLRKRPYPTY